MSRGLGDVYKRQFKMILDGEMDEYPENAFFNVGTIDEVIEKAKAEKAE